MAEAEIEDLKQKITAAKQAANDGDLKSAAGDVAGVNKLGLRTRRVLKGHQGKVADAQWAKNSPYIVSVAQDGTLIVWDATNGNKVNAIQLRSIWVMTTSFSPNGNMVASAGMENVVSVYNITQQDAGNPIAQLQGHEGVVTDCHFNSDSQIISTSGDQTAILWDVSQGNVVSTFRGHQGLVECVDVAPDGNTFVTGSCDNMCILWDVRSGKPICTTEGHTGDINDVQFFPDGLCFASAADDTSVRLHDVRSQQTLQVYQHPNFDCAASSVCFSRSGRIMFVGYHNGVCEVWDTLKVNVFDGLEGHRKRVSVVRVCPENGQGVFTASWDFLIKVWA